MSAASAIRWQQLAAQRGTPEPQRQGGDRRSARIEAHADLILGAYEATPDITLAELQALLSEHAIEVGYEASFELDEPTLADAGKLDGHFAAMGGWIASTLVRLADLDFDFLPPDDEGPEP